MKLAPEIARFGTVEGNLTTRGALGFINPRKMDFRLKPDAFLLKGLPSFEAIPFDRIGPE